MSERHGDDPRAGRVYPRSRRRPNLRGSLGCLALVILLICGCNAGLYLWTKKRCEERGGHIEIIYGRDLLWHCVDAERGP